MEESFFVKPEIRWADLDPNFHVLHSKYYDFAAYCRTKFLVLNGITPQRMTDLKIGPVLFKESCIFRKELRFEDSIKVYMELVKILPDYSRWRIRHKIVKNDEVVSASIEVDIAWIDSELRKLIVPPEIVGNVTERIPRANDFEIAQRKSDFQ